MSQNRTSRGCFNIALLAFIFLAARNFMKGEFMLGSIFSFALILIFYNMYKTSEKTRRERQKQHEDNAHRNFGETEFESPYHGNREVVEIFESVLAAEPVRTENNSREQYQENEPDYDNNIWGTKSVGNLSNYFFWQTDSLLASDNMSNLQNHFNKGQTALNDLAALSSSSPDYELEVKRAFERKKYKSQTALDIALNPLNVQLFRDLYADKMYQTFTSVYYRELEVIKENPKRKNEIIKALLVYTDVIKAELRNCGKNDKIYGYFEDLTDKRQELYALKLTFD